MAAPAVGFVAAGGRSRRMGRDKALLAWDGATLLDHAVARLQACGLEVHLLSGAEPRYADRGLPVHVDVVAERGPLAGLLTALLAVDAGAVLLLAVDVPFVPVALLRELLARREEAAAVVPVVGGVPQPLAAVYGAACREPVRRCLERGASKMTDFWDEVAVRRVEDTELAAFGDPATLFRNLNTLEDYVALRPALR
jgi:molybdopterin-guanine dinucleotide biosynthesis protein A